MAIYTHASICLPYTRTKIERHLEKRLEEIKINLNETSFDQVNNGISRRNRDVEIQLLPWNYIEAIIEKIQESDSPVRDALDVNYFREVEYKKTFPCDPREQLDYFRKMLNQSHKRIGWEQASFNIPNFKTLEYDFVDIVFSSDRNYPLIELRTNSESFMKEADAYFSPQKKCHWSNGGGDYSRNHSIRSKSSIHALDTVVDFVYQRLDSIKNS